MTQQRRTKNEHSILASISHFSKGWNNTITPINNTLSGLNILFCTYNYMALPSFSIRFLVTPIKISSEQLKAQRWIRDRGTSSGDIIGIRLFLVVSSRNGKVFLEVTTCIKRTPMGDYKNLPRLCTGTGKSTRVWKICSPRRGLPSRGCWISLTRGWISLSLYKIVVDYFSPSTLNPHNKTPFSLSKTTSKRCLVRKRRQLGLIMTSCHCMIYDVTRCSLKRSCLSRGR